MRRTPWSRALTVISAVAVVAAGGAVTAAYAAPAQAAVRAAPARAAAVAAKPKVVYAHLALPAGKTATVYSDGMAELRNRKTGMVQDTMLPLSDLTTRPGGAVLDVPKAQVLTDLTKGAPERYLPGRAEIVLAPDVTSAAAVSVPRSTLARLAGLTGQALAAAAPRYTSSATLNGRLAQLGVTRMSRLLPSVSPATPGGSAGLDLSRAYVVSVASGVPQAVSSLRAEPGIAYAEPDWTVSTMNTAPRVIGAAAQHTATERAAALRKLRQRTAARATAGPAALPALPPNYALSASAQSLLNHPGVNWAPAYETLQARYHQLPGAGEIITNVSLGDLTNATLPASNPCTPFMQANGPTTVVRKGQRYLDLPSLPLIPTYVASASGRLNGAAATCGQDPADGEIDLDFSMMAGLPHDQQRPGSVGSGYTDLLGIAPGASYRLVVPASETPGISDIDAALLAASKQSPRPDVITASLAFGNDAFGFPSRYLEDDAVTEALIAGITHTDHITITLSSNDGLRTFTNAAFGPSGGSAATQTGGKPTDLNDVTLSSAPSVVRDSGSIDVGGTTLDDIFAAPPQGQANAKLAAQHAFPETRYDGFTTFSSGFGSRVNVSAPADNVIALEHTLGGKAGDAVPVIDGGTSASAPEVAASAAVVQQAARLTGDKKLATDPAALRSWLATTGAAVPDPRQADQRLNVGPQVDLGHAVTTLVADMTGFTLPAGVARVAVEQRQIFAFGDATFVGDTDPSNISLAGLDQDAWITIAPDWTGRPVPGSFRLTAGGHTVARTPWARLSAQQIFSAAGAAFPPAAGTTITLTYRAAFAHGEQASVKIPLTFSAAGSVAGQIQEPLAPVVPGVVTGPVIPVHYDVSRASDFTDPTLVVSEPGRPVPWAVGWRIAYQKVLPAASGTVDVPVAALQGGGIYGISVQAGRQIDEFSDFAFTRVSGAGSDARPPAPTLAAKGQPAGHQLEIPYHGRFTVSWDVRNVPGAAGATLEVSAAGPALGGNFSMFNNPNGTVRDSNGLDFGSVYHRSLRGAHGTITLSAATAGLIPSMVHSVRVLPVTASGAAAGEASDVSSIQRDGVTVPTGESVGDPFTGIGVDRNGPSGFVSAATLGSSLGSVGPGTLSRFDQATNATTGVIDSSAADHFFGTLNLGPGVFAGHVGLYQDTNLASQTATYHTFDVTSGKPGPRWSPPPGDLPPSPRLGFNSASKIIPADNQSSSDAAFFSGQNFNGPGWKPDWKVFTSNVGAGTFGPARNLAPAMKPISQPEIVGFGQDTATSTAVAAANDGATGKPWIITASLKDGSVSSFSPSNTFSDTFDAFVGFGLAVDPNAGTVLTAGDDGISIDNIAHQTGHTLKPESGVNGTVDSLFLAPTVDASRKEFAVLEAGGPDSVFGLANPHAPGNAFRGTSNNNALSSVLLFNEQGKLLKRIEKFSLPQAFLDTQSTLQLDPATGTGYTIGADGASLEPFTYTGK